MRNLTFFPSSSNKPRQRFAWMAMRMTVKNKIKSNQGRADGFQFEIASKNGILFRIYANPPTVTMTFIAVKSIFVIFFRLSGCISLI